MSKKPRRLKADPRSCSHCGRRVTSRGRSSATGRYYCSANSECQAAKQRNWRRENFVAKDRPAAPTICSCCSRALTPRPVRQGDSPHGRWCRAAKCQKDRALVEGGASLGGESERLIIRFLATIEAPGGVRRCPACGLEDAVLGFLHPLMVDGKTEACFEMGRDPIKKTLAEMRWPEFF